MSRLDLRRLGQLPGQVGRPAYDPARVRKGIVHLGVGNFHRAHQAAYTDAAMSAGDLDWGIVGVSLRSPATRDALAAQDGLYTLIERDAQGDRARVVGSVRELLVAPEGPRAVVERIAAATTRIVSLTVTEKGYGRALSSGGLDLAAPGIEGDLRDPGRPATAVGLLYAGCREREARGAGGFTVLSCDNLSGNGRIVRRLLLEFAGAVRPGPGEDGARASRALRDWIEREMSFPDAMVDRIVPQTTDEHRTLARRLTGCEDAWPVATEPFTQWVIEDRFVAGRPQWQAHGAEFVDDVSGWETMKLRLLNAAHSSLAYLGVPAGLETVDRAIGEPALRAFVEAMWAREVAPGLDASVRARVPAYCASLIARFANPALGHRTRQIAMDGSQKLPMRLLPSLRARIERGEPFELLAFAVAAWIRYLEGRTESGGTYPIDDPARARLESAIAQAGPDARSAVSALLRVEEVFGADLARDPRAAQVIAAQLGRLRALGSVAAARAVLEQRAGVDN